MFEAVWDRGAMGVVAGPPAKQGSLRAVTHGWWLGLDRQLDHSTCICAWQQVEVTAEPELTSQPSLSCTCILYVLVKQRSLLFLLHMCSKASIKVLPSVHCAHHELQCCVSLLHSLPAEKRSVFNQHESTVFDNLVALIMDARKLQVRERFVPL